MNNFENLNAGVDSESENKILTLSEYEKMQIREALGSVNMYYTGLELGHQPTPDEAMMHYYEKGGADIFRKRFGYRLKGRHEDKNKKVSS